MFWVCLIFLFWVCLNFVCLEFVWSFFRVCLNYDLSLFEVPLEFVWSPFGVCLEFVLIWSLFRVCLELFLSLFICSLFGVCVKFCFEVCQEFVRSLNIQTNFKTSVFMRSKSKLVLLDERGQNVPLCSFLWRWRRLWWEKVWLMLLW